LYEKKLAGFLESDRGFYFLKGRVELVEKRIFSQKLSALKIKRLLKIVGWLQYVPFVRMIGVTGRLAMGQAHKKSDWDILVALKGGKIWTGRTLLTALAHLAGKRRYGKHVADRICLNFFISDEKLEIITKDLFSASEYMFMFPIYGWETFKHFQLRNIWISSMKPTYFPDVLAPTYAKRGGGLPLKLKKLGEYLFNWNIFEDLLRKLEKQRILDNPKTKQEGSLVYAGDDALIFLPDPHGPRIFEKFKHNVSRLGS
jgi:predicted nucleotidyltransferase